MISTVDLLLGSLGSFKDLLVKCGLKLWIPYALKPHVLQIYSAEVFRVPIQVFKLKPQLGQLSHLMEDWLGAPGAPGLG